MVGDPCLLGIAQIPGNSDFCITCDGVISPNYTYEVIDGSFVQLRVLKENATKVTALPLGPVIRSSDERNNEEFWTAAAAAAGVTGVYGVDYPASVAQAARAVVTDLEVEAGSVLLSDLVEDLCIRTRKLTPEQLNTGALNDVLVGYGIGRQATARANLEPLRQAYFFDLIESEGLIKAVKRGGSAVATITADDLGAGEGEAAAHLIEPMRQQEAELPATLVVAYAAADTDYQTGTQRERRITTLSDQQVSVELPVVLTDQKAAEVAAVLMYDAWVGRTQRKWNTTRKWCHLEPGDLVNLDDGEFVVLVRIVDKLESGPVIEWLSVDEDVAAYAPNVSPSLTAGDGSVIRFDGPTKLELLDIPIAQDTDNDPGYYAAVTGYTPSWPAARLFRSADAGVTYAEVRDMTLRATLGYATTALGAWTGGNMVDEGNTVTVRLHGSGTLASVTNAALLANANAAALGQEVIQFRTATLVSAGVYTLSGLLRGRLGTEQHMGTHAAGDRFVLLNPQIYRIPAPLGQVGVAADYKAVTFGQSLADATAQTFTNTGAGLKPQSPVHLEVVPTATAYAVQWLRRTRIGPAWADGMDVPLGETSERYRVRVLDGAVVVEEQVVTSTSATLAPAAPGDYDGMSCEVVQLSDLVGAGFPATETI